MGKTFLCINFGCRVNAAETNQFAQKLISDGYTPLLSSKEGPGVDLIFINTCSVTAKANIESLGKIRSLRHQYPNAKIVVSGCADLRNIEVLPNISIINNVEKEKILEKINGAYRPQIGDKFSHTHRYILKVQSGCTHNCSYCTVPQKRPYLWSLPITTAIDTVNQAIKNGYQEIIISGVNLDQYKYGFSTLIESLLKNTSVPLISFGSIPLNCIDSRFLSLMTDYRLQITNFLHIPLQSGSDKILKLMHRPYNVKKIKEIFTSLKNITPRPVKGGAGGGFSFGTDIIVGFPGETDAEFEETYNLCKLIGFSKIHVFRFSHRPNTLITDYYKSCLKPSKVDIKSRAEKLRKLST
ncbi:MAG: radical SAM protein [Candidatus Shapirobacteria bacterium]|jgi:threonylcarbamoyladenosine tRNA methylthiotransferase MtaB